MNLKEHDLFGKDRGNKVAAAAAAAVEKRSRVKGLIFKPISK
jgi:hypothetical protein